MRRFLALRFVFSQTGPINQGVPEIMKAPMEKTDHRFGDELETIVIVTESELRISSGEVREKETGNIKAGDGFGGD
jgi:hypothetical protein